MLIHGSTSVIDNSITQNSSNVKNNTDTNKFIQNIENNTFNKYENKIIKGQKRSINGSFDGWMEQNKIDNRIVYDIDEGILKRPTKGQGLQLPNSDSKSNTTNKTGSSINHSIPQTTEVVKSDIAINKQFMQNNENNVQEQKKIQKELHNRIANATLSKNTRKNTYLGRVSDNVAKKVKSLLGIDISNRTHLLMDNDIRHMLKQHGNTEIERARGQIAITNRDIEKIPEILNNYDRIEKGTDNKQGKTIRYIKEYSNNQTYVVEVIPTANNTTLYVKTMWKKTINNKKEAVALTNSKNAPSSTSKTRGNLASKINIPQNSKNVKNGEIETPQNNKNIHFAKKTVFSDNGIRAERTENNINTKPYDERKYEKNKDFINYLKENSYLQNIMKVDSTSGETYAHSSNRLLEQEIRRATNEGNLDKNIPVTKITDIDADIEKYLGKTIGKGHFREHARGIYNKNTDRISIKEYKDLDNIFHELGHALDLGNRISVDKASLSDELLLAIKRHGGYENDTIGVQLDEGFAEILKAYAINKDIVKQDYPKSFKVLEDFKTNNASFEKFITKLQQDTYNYIHQTDINKLTSNLSIGEKSKRLTHEEIKNKLVYWFLDDNQYVKNASRKLAEASGKKFEDLKPSENPYLLLRLMSGTQSKAVSMITDGYINLNGEKAFPGLSELNNILGEDAETWKNFRAYITALRDLEYKNSNYKTGIRTLSSKNVIEELYNDKSIQKATKILQENTKGFLQYAVDNYLIDIETADNLQQNNVFYVPFYRDMQDVSKSNINNKSSFDNLFKKRTGSELDIKDPLENVIVNAANIVQAVETNNVLNAFYKLGKSAGTMNDIFKEISTPVIKVSTQQLAMWENELQNQGVDTTNLDLEKTADIFAPNNKIDIANRVVSFIDENGKRRYIQFDKDAVDIFKTLLAIDKETSNRVCKFFEIINTPLRYGATAWNPSFYVSNMQADSQQAFVYSDKVFIPIIDNIKGVVDFASTYDKGAGKIAKLINAEYVGEQEKILQLYKQSGASSATRLSQERKSVQKIMSEVYGVKNSETLGIANRYKAVKKLANLFNTAGDISEQSTRFRVFNKNYNKLKQEGWSEVDIRAKSALEARDATQDFNRMGSIMRKYINKAIVFSGARVGSLLTFQEKIKSKPKRTMMRIAIISTLSLIFKALSSDDDEINEINQRKKDDYYIFRFGDVIMTLKKPQGLLKSLINLNELVFDFVTGKVQENKVDERITNWVRNTLMDSSIADNITGIVPSSLATILENYVDKDFYYNSDIVNSYDKEKLPERQQYYEYNSQLAIWLGQIFNYSPAKIDNTISGWFGGMGTEITKIIDFMLGKLGITAEKPEMGAEDAMVLKRFVINPTENSTSIDEVYQLKTELTQKTNDETVSRNEKEQAEKQLKVLEGATSEMAKINKQIKEIKKDLRKSGEQKAEEIKQLQKQKTDIARKALGKPLLYPENKKSLESIGFYPSGDTLSQNGYTLNLTSDMKKEYEKIAYERYKQYVKQGLYSEEKLESLKQTSKDYAKSQLLKKYKNDLIKKNK